MTIIRLVAVGANLRTDALPIAQAEGGNSQKAGRMRKLRGKKALVTGAASGIGRAVALRLAREGCDLFLLDIDLPGVTATAGAARQLGVDAIGVRCDLTRPSQITASNATMLDRWGGLDILVNNAGVAYYGPTENMTAQQWDWLLAINLLAPIQFVRELLPTLRSRPESHIVNVASVLGLVASARLTAYNVSKFGLVGLSASLRAEYGRQGVGVSTICPGFVGTNLFRVAASGRPGRPTPVPPGFLTTTPDRVADRVVGAIRRNRRLVVITPLAHLLWNVNRFAPGLLDWLQRFRRHRRVVQTAGGPTQVPAGTPVADALADTTALPSPSHRDAA
jgi:NAD(P)-dependent dehydrogenase (short-subunit alcohol dehydrogenase family)